MPLIADLFDNHVVERVLEFAAPATPWNRRLWQSGPIQLGLELLELAEAGGAAGSAKRDLQIDVIASLAGDAGLGPYAKAIRSSLPKDARDLTVGSHDWYSLTAALGQAAPDYLGRWAAALTLGRRPSAEFLARRVAGHLLDAGWSSNHLHRWTTYRVRHRLDPIALPKLLLEAQHDLAQPARPFEFCVPLSRAPALPRPTPAGWLTAHQVAAWRLTKIPGAQPIRQYGAVLITVTASDIYSAAETVRGRLADLAVRFSVGGRRTLEFAADMWAAGRPDALPVTGSPRRVEVHAFERQERLFDAQVPPGLAGALALLAPLDRGASPAAVIGAWSAVEALLTGPSDGANSVAAGRLALIVAASHMRAELTVLSWAHARSASDSLAADIAAAATNGEKAKTAQRALASGVRLATPRGDDARALARLAPLLADPHKGVASVQTILHRAFLRLYRQRNLIAHGGRVDGIGLEPTLRLAAPLVGAGVDRLAHAALTAGPTPLALAAAARVRLEVLAPATAAAAGGLIDLLGA